MPIVNFDYSSEYSNPSDTAEVTNDHFGVNYLFHHNEVSDANEGPTDFEEVVVKVGSDVIRYPGGTVTEEYFDPANPNGTTGISTFDDDPITGLTPLDDFLQYAADNGKDVIIVIPTWRYFDSTQPDNISGASKAEIRAFINDVLTDPRVTSGEVTIVGFEIGNEWYQDNFTWTVSQFGALSSQIAKIIQLEIDQINNGIDPGIYVQAARDDDDDETDNADNQALRDEYGSIEYAAVDGVITHFYGTNKNGNVLGIGGGVQTRLNEISDIWGDKDILVSEWNVGDNAPPKPTPISGLERNAPLMRMFAEMIENGVDTATFWTVEPSGQTAATLTWEKPDDIGSMLSPTGYLFRMMSENLPGMNLLVEDSSFKLDDINGAEVGYKFIYESGNKTVIYFVSGVDEDMDITADLAELVDGNSHIHATRLEMVPGTAPDEFKGEGQLIQLTQNDLETNANGTLHFELGAYQLIQIVITDQSSGRGVYWYGDDQNAIDDELVGTDNADTLKGHDGDDTLIGGAGGDVMSAGAGNDEIHLGSGDVMYFNGNVRNVGGSGRDTAVLTDGYVWNTSNWGAFGIEIVVGNAQNNVIRGAYNDVDFRFSGGAGNDLITTAGGNDTLIGGAGADAMSAGAGDDVIYLGNGDVMYSNGNVRNVGGSGRDTAILTEGYVWNTSNWGAFGIEIVVGNAENNVIRGAYNDVDFHFDGGAGDDLITTAGGNDTLIGGAGADAMSAGAGDDVIYLGSGDVMYSNGYARNIGGSGFDTAVLTEGYVWDTVNWGAFGIEAVVGNAENNVIRGAYDYVDFRFDGGAGNDLITTAGGNDTLNGGTGADTLTGGDGSDQFVFSDGFGTDAITDFDHSSELDVIDLSEVTAITSYADLIANHISQVGSDVLITDGSNTILIHDITLAELTEDAFAFT